MRNQVTNNIRNETKDFNNNRIDLAGDENEIWKVAKEIINPNSNSSDWSLKKGDELIQEPFQIANIFNEYFVEKIATLKNNIDAKLIEDPLSILKDKMNKIKDKPSLSIKQIKPKELKKAFKKLKNKNSVGSDGISQSQLLAGAPSLSEPLRKIFNLSITNGEFPKLWKQAIVTPVLKKG